MDLYRQNILDHHKHPRNFGTLKNADASAQAYNATCGDQIRMDIRIDVRNNIRVVGDIRFSGNGCAISQAAASMLSEMVKGMILTDVEKIDRKTVLDLLGTELTPSRTKCAMLPLEVMKKALQTKSP